MRIKEYIKKYGKIELRDTKNEFMFFSNGKDKIGGVFKNKRML